TQFEATLENGEEKELCLKGECTPYKWGKGIGQMGASESLQLWNTHWEAPKTHKNRFVRNFEKISKKLLKNCGGQPYLSKRCIKKFKQHVKNCEKYENLNQGTGHAFCFKPSFKMFAKKMLLAFSQKTTVWQEYVKDKKIHIRPKKIWEIIKESSQNDKSLLFANSARIRAGYINRGAMVNLSLQECVNHPGKLPCNYGNLSNTIGRRPASETSLGTPAKYLGAQILKGEFINRCHVWYFAGLCGPIRKNSLLDQYTRIYQRDVGSLPTLKATAL
ncbi:MAG: hypothetical protein HRT44_04870, partial [Bdellovibrionales bacterium]|nr:hypothetical protein [Bdellovibrionales bacterium]NQZ18574.1 hypothetical protein [Bdellovibrionales bacterium]